MVLVSLQNVEIPDCSAYHLSAFEFSDAALSEEHTILAAVRIFIDSGMVEAFKINAKVVYSCNMCMILFESGNGVHVCAVDAV